MQFYTTSLKTHKLTYTGIDNGKLYGSEEVGFMTRVLKNKNY